jgi:predicted nucleic acid-binding protein
MRVVVDTNVFVSAALSAKSLPALAVYLVERRGILLKSTATEQEVLQVVERPHLAALIAPSLKEAFVS